MKEIQITRGAVAIVDDEDFERINSRKWALNPEGMGYAVRKGSKRCGEKRTVSMHQEIMYAPSGSIIDHINGNGLDNRKCNLRFANVQKNAFNKRKAKGPYTSKYKGVFRRKNKTKWTARIKYNDHHIELGDYPDEALAAAVYNFAAAIFFAEFRHENIGDEIPELPLEMQIKVFGRCKRAAERRGWYINTPAYRYYYSVCA